MKTGWGKHARGFFSVLVLTLALAALFQSWELAAMMIAGLMVHELGHIFAIRRHGIEWELRVELRGVAVITPLKERCKLDHFENSLIHLAGPFANLAYALLVIGLHFLLSPNPDNDYGLRLANFSAFSGLLNLLPIGKLSDGGKFVKRVFASLGEEKEKILLFFSLLAWSLSFAWIFYLFKPDAVSILGITLMGLWFFFQVVLESTLDNPDEAGSPQSMSPGQAGAMTAAMLVGLVSLTLVLLNTPAWMNEAASARMLSGWARALAVLASHPEETIAGLVAALAILLVVRNRRRPEPRR